MQSGRTLLPLHALRASRVVPKVGAYRWLGHTCVQNLPQESSLQTVFHAEIRPHPCISIPPLVSALRLLLGGNWCKRNYSWWLMLRKLEGVKRTTSTSCAAYRLPLIGVRLEGLALLSETFAGILSSKGR